MSKQSEYTYNTISQFLNVPPAVVTITATSIEEADDKMWETHKYQNTRLTHIDGKKYVPAKEQYVTSPADPEDRYWKNAATCAERFSNDDSDYWD